MDQSHAWFDPSFTNTKVSLPLKEVRGEVLLLVDHFSAIEYNSQELSVCLAPTEGIDSRVQWRDL